RAQRAMLPPALCSLDSAATYRVDVAEALKDLARDVDSRPA
ncbi:MAG: hypothetical protein WC681_04340, partial [Sterolibacterium sp.]